MNDNLNIRLFDNYEEESGTLIPTIYSSRKFIEYIARYLRDNSILSDSGVIPNFEFAAGSKLMVNTVDLGNNKSKVTYSYNDATPPTGSVNNFTAEYGVQFAPGELTMNVSVNRKSYPIELVEWLSGVAPAIQENKTTLSSIEVGSSYTKSITNADQIGPEDTLVASGGVYEDTYKQGGSLSSSITRKSRQFWGAINSTIDVYDIHGADWNDSLGTLPSQLTIAHGSSPTHFIIVSSQNIEVFANGMQVGMTKQTNVAKSPYLADLSYSKNYNVYISTSKSTGDYTYTIKNA